MLKYLAAAFVLWAAPALAQDAPLGYAEATTGGTGKSCAATDLASLENCLRTSHVINVTGTIAIPRPPGTGDSGGVGNKAYLPSPLNRTTITGDTGAKLTGPSTLLKIDSRSNIIVRNLIFQSTLTDHAACTATHWTVNPNEHFGCGIGMLIMGKSRNVWVDHDTFLHCGEKCISIWTYPPKLATDPMQTPDLISISWSLFQDSYFGIAAGVSGSLETLPRQPTRISFYDDHFDQIFRRAPKMQATWGHMWNSVVEEWGGPLPDCRSQRFGFGPSSSGTGELKLENNVFSAWPSAGSCKQAVESQDYNSDDGVARGQGYFEIRGDELLNDATDAVAGSYLMHIDVPYHYIPLSAEDAYDDVMDATTGAGAH